MLHLSTQEVVLSIENTKIQEENNHVYQHYHNFFGNTDTFDLDFDDVIFDQLENQEQIPSYQSRHTIMSTSLVELFSFTTFNSSSFCARSLSRWFQLVAGTS